MVGGEEEVMMRGEVRRRLEVMMRWGVIALTVLDAVDDAQAALDDRQQALRDQERGPLGCSSCFCCCCSFSSCSC